MKYTYEQVKFPTGEVNEQIIFRVEDRSFIPCDLSNSDYQRYLRWLENPDADESGTL